MLIKTKAHYYSDITTFYCKIGTKDAFLGKHYWKLQKETKSVDKECYISLKDLEILFSPDWIQKNEDGKLFIFINDMSITMEENNCCVEIKASNQTGQISMDYPLIKEEDSYYIPISSFFGQVLGANLAVRKPYIMVSEIFTEIDFKKAYLYMNTRLSQKKQYGDFFETFWYEPAKRLVPYRVYVPTTYRKDTPAKLIVCLHGANGNHNTVFDRNKSSWINRTTDGRTQIKPEKHRNNYFESKRNL